MKSELSLLRALLSELEQLGARCSLRREVLVSDAQQLDALLEVSFQGSTRSFAIETKGRAPFRSELPSLFARTGLLTKHGTPLLLTSEIGATLANTLIEHGWSWADQHGNYDLRAPGLCLRQAGRVGDSKPAQQLPRGLAGSRVIRWLIAGLGSPPREAIKIRDLAGHIGVSAPAVSKVAKQLRQLGFVGGRRGLSDIDREALLQAFVREYPGAGGGIEYAYTLDAPEKLARRLEASLGDAIALSADIGPDRLVPWRAPTSVIVYVKTPQLGSDFDLVAAEDPGDANVLLQYPEDMSVFTIPGGPRELAPTLADPTQMLIDLYRLGGDDRLEAAEKLERWLLK